jgi:hypothetical protein
MSGYSLNGSNVIPYTPGQSGVKIQYGSAGSSPTQNYGTVTFSEPFNSVPVITTGMTMPPNSIYSFTVGITAISDASFAYKKFYNNTSASNSEGFFWFAIGN